MALQETLRGWRVGRAFIVLNAALLMAAQAIPAHAQTTFDRITRNGQINVGFRVDAAPFSYLDAQHKPQGYSIDVCNAVVAEVDKQLGVSGLRINMVPIDIDRVTTYMNTGSVDILCSDTSDTPRRRAMMSFSNPIYLDGVSIVVRRRDGITNIGQLSGKQVVVTKATTAKAALEAYAKKGSLDWKVATALDADAALSQLQLGWVSAYARDRVPLTVQVDSLADANDFVILPEKLSTESIAIAYRKDDQAMGTLINRVIASAATSGKARDWYDTWFIKPIPLNKRQIPLGLPMSPELKAAMVGAS